MKEYIVKYKVIGFSEVFAMVVVATDENEASWITRNKVRLKGGELWQIKNIKRKV